MSSKCKEYKTHKSWAKACKKERGNECEYCFWNEATCHAHHVIPVSEGGKHDLCNCLILCPNCHALAHSS